MAMSDHKAKDAAMAAYMKQHPSAFPDSVRRPWPGNGAGLRALAQQLGGNVPNNSSKWHVGMLGGVLCARLGMGDANVPNELRKVA